MTFEKSSRNMFRLGLRPDCADMTQGQYCDIYFVPERILDIKLSRGMKLLKI